MTIKRIGFTCLVFREDKAFVSFCPELGVASCGDTVEEARKRLKEAIRLFLEESEKMGTLKDILEEEGYTPKDSSGKEWVSPPLVASEHAELAL